MKKFYEAITKVRNSGIDMTSGEMIMREMKALVGDSCSLECRWLKSALKRNMQMEFVGKEQKTLNEKNQIVGKVRKQLTLEENLNDIAVDVTIIALMLLANWKEDYYNDFDISYIDTAGATDSKLTFESKSLKEEEEKPLNKKVNTNENTETLKKGIFDIEHKKKSFSNRASKPLDATVDIIEESDGRGIRKIVIPIVGGIICLALVFSIGRVILGRDSKTASDNNVNINSEQTESDSDGKEGNSAPSTTGTGTDTKTSEQTGADRTKNLLDLPSLTEESTDKLSLKHSIRDKDGKLHDSVLCRGYETSEEAQYWTWNIGGQYTKLIATHIIKEEDKALSGEAHCVIYGDEIKLKESIISGGDKLQEFEIDVKGKQKLKIQLWSNNLNNDEKYIESLLADIKLYK